MKYYVILLLHISLNGYNEIMKICNDSQYKLEYLLSKLVIIETDIKTWCFYG